MGLSARVLQRVRRRIKLSWRQMLGQFQRYLMPSHTARGCAGETAFSWVQASGLSRNEPLGLNGLRVRNPAVA